MSFAGTWQSFAVLWLQSSGWFGRVGNLVCFKETMLSIPQPGKLVTGTDSAPWQPQISAGAFCLLLHFEPRPIGNKAAVVVLRMEDLRWGGVGQALTGRKVGI